MKNLPIISLLIIGLASCGTDNTPTPQRMTQNVQSIPGNTVISVVSQDKYDAPHGAEIIEKKGSYRVIDNIYDTDGYQVLIPRNALISGIYTNDGVNCQIHWKAIYANEKEYEENRGSFVLDQTTSPSICVPTRGIKKGDRLVIRFNQVNYN
ncbi:MAG: hypothetical protein QG673_1675 [Pseudomonadota bacterium]|nr:hypothetical protein [Pseudomonadota bacterium]